MKAKKVCICQITGEPCMLNEEVCYYMDCEFYYFCVILKYKQERSKDGLN